MNKASLQMEAYQQRMMKYHNAKVRLRSFDNGDLVLWKVSIATQIPGDGKLGPNWEGPYRVTKSTQNNTHYLETLEGELLPQPWNIEHLKRYYQ